MSMSMYTSTNSKTPTITTPYDVYNYDVNDVSRKYHDSYDSNVTNDNKSKRSNNSNSSINNSGAQGSQGSQSIVDEDEKKISSFNYDSLYNTSDLTQKYSFLNSSFLYRPFSKNDNEYLSEIYFNNNPLETEIMCSKLSAETCGLTSTCVYAGENKCLPGNARGPYTTYSDVNIDYYYYKGKCYGNCPGKFYPSETTMPSPSSTPTATYATTISSSPVSTYTTTPTSSSINAVKYPSTSMTPTPNKNVKMSIKSVSNNY